MIWIGTSGWVYPHWVGRFYPRDLPQSAWLPYYVARFPTVEINRSFYRLPDRAQFQAWAAEVSGELGFLFAVKGSRYVTHLKKLRDAEEGVGRLVHAAEGLGPRLGPFLYQLPPHWHADPDRLGRFVALLPRAHRAAFEFRDPSWFRPDVLRILADAGCALVEAVGGEGLTPLDLPATGPFRYVRFHHGAHGMGFGEDELSFWAGRIGGAAATGVDVYAYFNNDPDGHALVDVQRLRALLEQHGGAQIAAPAESLPG
jgi:uncharacterized protein YecE (DUF72 family)